MIDFVINISSDFVKIKSKIQIVLSARKNKNDKTRWWMISNNEKQRNLYIGYPRRIFIKFSLISITEIGATATCCIKISNVISLLIKLIIKSFLTNNKNNLNMTFLIQIHIKPFNKVQYLWSNFYYFEIDRLKI